MTRLRALAASLVLAALTVVPLLGAPVPACASEDGARAALVVDTGAAVTTYCVSLGAPSVDGLDLIRLAGRQHGLSYSLGFGGQAVCSLAGVGVDGQDCFAAYPEFWGYWHGDGGGWTWSSSGPGGATVGDGDVEGWAWGTGDSGSSHPAPPRTGFDDVCVPTGGGSGGGGSGGGGGGQGQSPGPNHDDLTPLPAAPDREPRERERPRDGDRPRDRDRDRPEPSVTASPSEGIVIRAGDLPAAPSTEGGGPPAAMVLALVAALALAGGGWLRLRLRAPTA